MHKIENLRELQLVETKILKEFIQFCEKYNLRQKTSQIGLKCKIVLPVVIKTTRIERLVDTTKTGSLHVSANIERGYIRHPQIHDNSVRESGEDVCRKVQMSFFCTRFYA